MGIKKGTKLTETPKDITLKIRLDKQTEERLEAVCNATNKKKAQVIRDGIDEQYAKIEKK